MTPPYRGSISGWTSTAIGWSAAPARSRESRTAITAVTNSSNPLIPITDSNWPAIDDSAVSSTTEELRATSARSSPPARSKASFTAACAGGVGSAIDGVAEGRGEDDAGQGVEPGGRALCQSRRLAAGETRVLRHLVRQIDDERSCRSHAG